MLQKKWFLYLTEFFAGMSVMAVELGASRLMAPYFSSSQIVWTVIIGVIMIVFCNRKAACKPYIAVISCADAQTEHAVAAYLKAHTDKALIKSKSAQKGCIELSYEVTLKQDNTGFITELSELDGVSSAVLVSYNGDYMG